MALQSLLPANLRDHLRLLTRRQVVTRIPDWDALIPPDQPDFDRSAAWADISAQIDAYAAAGALDDSHGDLVDRLIHPITNQWRADADYHRDHQLRVLHRLEEQGIEHHHKLASIITERRTDLDRATVLFTNAWNTLTGHSRSATSATPALAQPHPPATAEPDTRPGQDPLPLHLVA